MTTHSRVPRRTTAIIAIIFFLLSLIFFIIWSTVTLKYGEVSERDHIDIFLSYFPQWMQSYIGIHLFSLICSIIATVLAGRSYKKRLLSIRVLMLLVVIGSIFLIIFNIVQLI